MQFVMLRNSWLGVDESYKMFPFFKFGYALRHRFTYESKRKSGSLVLWSSYDGTYIAPDPTINGGNLLSQFLSIDSQRYGGSHHIEIPVGDENDIFPLLASLIMIRDGKECSFSNFQDRKISFALTEAGAEKKKVISVKIRYNTNSGVLTFDEVNELEVIARDILSNLGFSKQEIVEKVESIIAQFSN